MWIPTYRNKISWDGLKILVFKTLKYSFNTDWQISGLCCASCALGYFERWSEWPFQRYLCFAISGSCSCCKLFRCLSVAKAALLPVCFEGDGGTRNSLRCYYLFFIRPVSLNLYRLNIEEQVTCPIEVSNLGVNAMIDEAATGDEYCRCVGFLLKAISGEASIKSGIHLTVLS